jgi:hypothetical protein
LDPVTQDTLHTVLALDWHAMVCTYPEEHPLQGLQGSNPVPEKVDPATQDLVHMVFPVRLQAPVCMYPEEHPVQGMQGSIPVPE